ncbi:MAG: type II secretion system protein [Deltaproteobacteria bacterium]|nr:type II secretion system protein [Deltaproteobacteria bacterium]
MKHSEKVKRPEGRRQRMTAGAFIKLRTGFTLIEVILVLVLATFVSAMLITSLGFNLKRSATTVAQVDQQYQLIQEMESLTSNYRKEILARTLDLNTFYSTYVVSIGNIDTANTGFITLTSTGATPFTTAQILRVTLRDGDQTVQSLFTE